MSIIRDRCGEATIHPACGSRAGQFSTDGNRAPTGLSDWGSENTLAVTTTNGVFAELVSPLTVELMEMQMRRTVIGSYGFGTHRAAIGCGVEHD
ncbi:hypothetical protein [Burkholderia anthina]|uniref:hypothetical protein n=1 Tax=Burkholderia anthina TaxID=179879 RepID=UPI0015890038